jgi:hypothetical protein
MEDLDADLDAHLDWHRLPFALAECSSAYDKKREPRRVLSISSETIMLMRLGQTLSETFCFKAHKSILYLHKNFSISVKDIYR